MSSDPLARPGRILRLLNRSPIAAEAPGAAVEYRHRHGDLLWTPCRQRSKSGRRDPPRRDQPGRTFKEILSPMSRAATVLEAARRQGCARASWPPQQPPGYATRDDAPPGGLPADQPPRPDCSSGGANAWNPSVASTSTPTGCDVFSSDRVVFRGAHEPSTLADLDAADDAARLVEACLNTDHGGYQTVWGVSRNSRGSGWLLEAGEKIGYHPVDDAEHFAGPLLAEFGEPDLDQPVHRLVGGQTCAVPLGQWVN